MCKVSGIYQIRNIINGKLYIGSSSSIFDRRTEHFRNLRQNKHHSPLLQRSYNKYGKENFIHSILEECSPIDEILEDREQYYLDTLLFAKEYIKSKGKDQRFYELGLNVNPKSNNCGSRRVTDEFRKKMSLLAKNRTKEHIEKLRQSRLGTHLTNTTKTKISIANLGKTHSVETKKKQSETHKSIMTSERRNNVSKFHKGRKRTSQTIDNMKSAQVKRRAKEKILNGTNL